MAHGFVCLHSRMWSHHKAEAGFILLHGLVVSRLIWCQLLRVIRWGGENAWLRRCFQAVKILSHAVLTERNLVGRKTKKDF